MLKKKLFLSLVFVGVAGVALLGVRQVQAQSAGNPLSGLVQMLAQKFGLDQTQVQSVVDQYRQQQTTARQQNMQTREQARLDGLVKAGKITEAQKQAIITEQAVLKAKYNLANYKSLTPDQRKQQLQAEQAEIKTWAASQGIDPSYLRPGFGMRRMGGPKVWPKPSITPTP